MTQNFSTTITGLLVILIPQLGKMVGVEIGSAEVTQFIVTLTTLLGIALAWYGRVRKGDIHLSGIRKK